MFWLSGCVSPATLHEHADDTTDDHGLEHQALVESRLAGLTSIAPRSGRSVLTERRFQ